MTHHNQEKNYRWNFTVNLLDGASFWFGASFISATTILPLYISKLTPSLIPIGLIGIISSAGWFLPQLFSARITERVKKVKDIAVGWGLMLERFPVWVMMFSAILARSSPTLALIVFMVSQVWFAFGAGVVAPSWMALLAKIFSPEKRGSFLGTTMFIGGVMGVLGSAASAWFLENYAFPNSFIILFAAAAGSISLSWIFLAMTREPTGVVETHDQDWSAYWKDLIRIIKEDHNFRRFIISNIIITFGTMASGFVTVSAIERFDVSDATVGLYTLVMLVGQTVGNLVLGWMADRFGHKLSVEIGVLATFIAFVLALVMPSPGFYYVVYLLLGINLSTGIVSGMLVVWEFCETSRVPTYSGLANTTRGVAGLLAPMIATSLAGWSYDILFGICSILLLSGLILLFFWVKEPRWHSKNVEKIHEEST
jgi:MFS family permease